MNEPQPALLPCPFCGSHALLDAHADDCYFTLHSRLKGSGGDASLVLEAHAAWNRRTPAPVGVEPVAWAFQHDDGTWHDPSLTEHSAGMKGLAPADQVLAMGRVPQDGAVTADDLKQPGNGAQWRVEWWNESCRMLLPANKKLDRFQAYRNGTLMFTIKEKSGIKGGQRDS